jgi:hypothetical protein
MQSSASVQEPTCCGAMQAPALQLNPGAQSALELQLVLQAAPAWLQPKLFGHG